MARIDKFLAQLIAYQADALLVESGDNLYLRKGDNKQPLMQVKPGAISNAHVAALFNEVAPAEVQDSIGRCVNVSWNYRWGTFLFRTELCFVEGRIVARMRAIADTPVVVAPAVKEVDDDDVLLIARYFRVIPEGSGCDLHLTAGQRPMARVDGALLPLPDCGALDAYALQKLIEQIIPERARAALERDGDATFATEIDGARVRCTVFRDVGGTGGVFRRFPRRIRTVEALGLPASVVELCKLRMGLVLVTGAAGSGRSTTVAAMVDWINTNRADHVVTVEDPVEVIHAPKRCLINQRQVGEHTGSYAQALEAARREHPNVVVVGALRELDAIKAALEMAAQGQLVIAVTSAVTATAAVEGLLEAFPLDQQDGARAQLVGALKGAVTLLSRTDPADKPQGQRNKRGVRVSDADALVACLAPVMVPSLPLVAVTPPSSSSSSSSSRSTAHALPPGMGTVAGGSDCAINEALWELVLLGFTGDLARRAAHAPPVVTRSKARVAA